MIQQLAAECALTLRVLFRQPGFWVPTVLFPGMLYAFFGAQSVGSAWAANAMASFAVYAVLGVGFFQFGVSVAQDRESPFATWQSSLPGHAWVAWAARVLSSLVFVCIAALLVALLAVFMAEVALATAQWAQLGLICLICTVPATLMGIALGTYASARAAVPLANLFYLPLAYLGGLWVPPIAMPDLVGAISQWTPTRAMGELAWAAVNATDVPTQYILTLAAWTLFAVLAIVTRHLRTRWLMT